MELRYKRAHEVLFGQSMEISERFNSEQGICLLTKIFEVYQDIHAVTVPSMLCIIVSFLGAVLATVSRAHR